ncbi:fibrinogen beta chain-like [Tubulanus polymorphus]|uniref:fibrinogen beta chain-like n=1 Tax=Tubulanus polymorphus TaxID=672921 RepID=UPI003DA35DE4
MNYCTPCHRQLYVTSQSSATFDICANGGRFSIKQRRCICGPPWIGRLCEKKAQGCIDIYNEHASPDGWQWAKIQPPSSSSPIEVLCLLGHRQRAHTTILKRTGTIQTQYFNRSWAEYRDGFEEDPGNFWIGFDKLSEVMSYQTSEGYSLMFALTVIGPNNTSRSTRIDFESFNVSSEEQNYTISVNEISGDTGFFNSSILQNINETLNGMPFSTYDRANGNLSSNCAAEFGGGWWYSKSCADFLIVTGRNASLFSQLLSSVIVLIYN